MKQDLLNKIVQKGYDISYAANLNFATYDIVNLLPGWIAFLSIVAGILGVGWSEFTAKPISVKICIFCPMRDGRLFRVILVRLS